MQTIDLNTLNEAVESVAHVNENTYRNSQETKWEKLSSTGILWRKGSDIFIRGNLVGWIQKPMLASWEMAPYWTNLHIFKMAA